MPEMVASITRFTGDRKKMISWICHLPQSFSISIIDELAVGDYILFTPSRGLKIL